MLSRIHISKKLANRSIKADKRRNIFIIVTIAFAACLMTVLALYTFGKSHELKTFLPVSYTHLDVYKRQVHNHIIINSTTLDCQKKFRNFWGSTWAIRRMNDKHVSYTHLDVYKRQVLCHRRWHFWYSVSRILNPSSASLFMCRRSPAEVLLLPAKK